MRGVGSDGRGLSLRLWQELRPYWRHLIGIFFLSLFSPPLALLAPMPLKIAVDSVIGSRPLPSVLEALWPASVARTETVVLALVVGLVVLVALLAQVRDFVSSWLSAYTGEKLLRGFRARMFRHVQRLSLSYHDTKGTADSVYRIQYDAAALQNITVDGVMPFFTSALTFTTTICIIVGINWRIALVALA